MAEIIVNTTLDESDGDIFDGDVSLRDAIAAANAAAGADTIGFDEAVFNGEPGDILRLTQGQIAITDALSIDGGAGVTITGDAGGDDVTLAGGITDVDASLAGEDRLDDNSRIFNATAGLTLDGLTLTGGRTTAGGEGGGAVRATGALTLIDSTVSGNSTAGVGVFGAYRGAYGGGIYGGGDVTVTNSTIKGNSADGSSGGGIYVHYGHDLTVTNSTVIGNSAYISGGGIFGDTVAVTHSTVHGNSAARYRGAAGGGGIFGTYVFVTNSTVSGNGTMADYADGGGVWGAFVTVANSTVSDNSTAGLDGGGGGINGVYITVTNSTVSGNSTAADDADGGGILGSHITVTNSTVSGNSTAGRSAYGGGIYEIGGYYGAGSFTLTNSIVLGNATTYAGAERDEVAGVLVRTGGNIVGTDVFSGNADIGDTSAAAVFAATTEIAPGVFAGVLADNGGPTETIALRLAQGNPAIGGADPATAPPTDQRGVPRDADPDLGAFEAEQVGPPAPFRIEAETLARVSGFKLESLGAASGDMVIKSPNPKVEAHARFTFTEQDGLYDLDLGYFDEEDGKSSLAVFVDGVEVDSFRFDQKLGSSSAVAATRAERYIAGVEIETGDVIELVGHSNRDEPLRIDYLDFAFIDDLIS